MPEPNGFEVSIDGVTVRLGDVSKSPVIKWRDVVSFAAHPLRSWSKLMGRCLQLLVKECTMCLGSLGFAKLVGVCDLLCAAQRM